MSKRRIKRNDLVRIGKNAKVYRVEVSTTDRDGKQKFHLEADADHPDAAKRLSDAFRWFRPDELTPVISEANS
jgi:hypothetical protein